MSLTKEISDKKVNFEFNKEFINLFSKKIKENDTNFLNSTLKELHPADSADIIENLIPESRSKIFSLEIRPTSTPTAVPVGRCTVVGRLAG